MNKTILALILLISLVSFSCRRRPAAVNTDAAEISKVLDIQDIDFQYLTSRARISYKDKDNSFSANASIRIQKDSLIWVSVVPALGIEALRCLVTTDSIFIVDKINRRDMAYDFEEISQKVNFDVNFRLMQSVLIGNMPLPVVLHPGKLKKQEETFLLTQRREAAIFTNYIGRRSRKLERVVVDKKQENATLELNYGQFTALGEFLFPYESNARLVLGGNESEGSTNININYNRVELLNESPSFPFNRP
jgi:hypothetical protein